MPTNAINLKTVAIATDGRAVARPEGEKTVFVHEALPDEEIVANVFFEKKNFREASIETVVHPSRDRIVPRCPHYKECGGCSLQHASQDAQERFKKQWLLETLHRVGHWPQKEIEKAKTSLKFVQGEPWHYRQRIRVHATPAACGFRGRRSHNVVDVTECLVAHIAIQKQWSVIREQLKRQTHSANPSEFEITVTADEELVIEPIRERVRTEGKASSEDLIPIAHPFARDFAVHRKSFVQPHKDAMPAYARAILEEITYFARSCAIQELNAWDLYAGSGPFSFLAALAGERLSLEAHCTAVEGVGPAVEALVRNTQNYNIKAMTDDVNLFVAKAHSKKPNIVILDPPRAGASAQTCSSIAKSCKKTALIIYVACDAASLARDACSFFEQGFSLESISIYDMFAQTVHYETLAVFRRVAT
jgi:23S rRNA (uracil1939-C5)-methyltransferase